MARTGMDTSAVLKLYRAEPNSPEVVACLAPDDELLISELVALEVVSAAYGLVRQRIIAPSEVGALIAAFDIDRVNDTVLLFDATILGETERLLK